MQILSFAISIPQNEAQKQIHMFHIDQIKRVDELNISTFSESCSKQHFTSKLTACLGKGQISIKKSANPSDGGAQKLGNDLWHDSGIYCSQDIGK